MASAEYRAVWPLHPSCAVGAPSAGVGEAVPLGPLSVPPAWTTS
ncbi:PPE family protein, SVP subgroup, partial [Escherichia coli]